MSGSGSWMGARNVEAAIVPWAPWVPEPDVCVELIESLSRSERHILELTARGYQRAEIATLRGCEVRTIENHLKHAFAKLGIVSNQIGALAVLRRAQLA